MPKCDLCQKEASRSRLYGQTTIWYCAEHGRLKSEKIPNKLSMSQYNKITEKPKNYYDASEEIRKFASRKSQKTTYD